MSDTATANQRISIQNTFAGVNELLQGVDAFLAVADIPSAVRVRIRLAVYEIASNIVEHSGMDDSRVFEVICSDHQHSIDFLFRSGGKQFNSAEAVKPIEKAEKPKFAKRGYGLKCVIAVVDAIAYRYNEGMNELVITFKREAAV